MAISYIQSAQSFTAGANGSASFSSDATKNNLVLAWIILDNSAIASPSGTNGELFFNPVFQTNTGDSTVSISLFYTTIGVLSTGPMTISYTSTGASNSTIIIAEYSGLSHQPSDSSFYGNGPSSRPDAVSSTALGASAAPGSLSNYSGATSTLFVGLAAGLLNGGEVYTSPGGYNSRESSNSHYSFDLSDIIVSGSDTESPTWSVSASVNNTSGLAEYEVRPDNRRPSSFFTMFN